MPENKVCPDITPRTKTNMPDIAAVKIQRYRYILLESPACIRI